MEENMIMELQKLGVNVEKAVSRFAGKKERYKKYMKLHVEQGFYNMLLEALSSDDIESAERYSHTLKGDFRNFEFDELVPVMVKINEVLKTGTKEGVQELIDSINPQYIQICEVIKKY